MRQHKKIENVYTQEEKNRIFNRLNEERIKKREEKEQSKPAPRYHPKEKNEILKKLDDERRENQEHAKLHHNKYGNKKVYTLENKEFFKIIGLARDYFILIEDCQVRSSHSELITLYHRGLDGFNKSQVLVKFKHHTDKIFISEDTLRIYYRASSLELDE